jgi:Protoporphyrinogen oxidase
MEHVKYLILGAGPAGLTFACRLKQKGEGSFFVLEKEPEAGGLCRSRVVDGAPLDIGGGHFLDVRRPAVVEFLFGFMPEEEWDRYERNSKIAFDGGYIDHPFEANIWQMTPEKQREYMESIACAGCNRGEEMPEEFVDWVYWKLGGKIAEEYMLPYNRKMFGANLNRLGTYWLEKLPSVSYEETKLSCENKRPYGQQPGHAQFFYPKKYGFGEVWLRMQKSLGDRIRLETAVKRMEIMPDGRKRVTCGDGSVYEAEMVITTVPWAEWEAVEGMPEELRGDTWKLCHSSIQIEYVSGRMDTDAQWIYYPQEEIPYHRILVRHNFCPDSEGYWTETNMERIEPDTGRFRYGVEYAYPLNTVEKPKIMNRLLAWARTKKIYGLGRWGEHEHYNADLVVELAMKLADELMSSGSPEGKGFGI